jgi:hypothetical protein
MSYLFKIRDRNVYPNEETLLVPPFKKLWERDRTREKLEATKEFAYIEFMTSMLKSNPYRGYKKEKRSETIIKDLMINKNWKPDKLVLEGIKKIETFQKEASPSFSLYEAAIRAKNNLESFLSEIDLNGESNYTDKGNMILKPKDVTSAILDVPKVTESLHELEEKIQEEIFEEVKTRANKEISIFAKMESFD